jgi:hypothetical protein
VTGAELDVLAGDHDRAAGVHFSLGTQRSRGSGGGGRGVDGVRAPFRRPSWSMPKGPRRPVSHRDLTGR